MTNYRDRVKPLYPTEESNELRLKKTVFLAYTDVAAGGIRALLGINMRKEFYNLDIPQVAGNKLACISMEPMDPRDKQPAPVQVWNLKYEQFSVILVNTVLSGDKCHYVGNKIMDLITHSCIDKLVILSALRVEVPITDIQEMYENTLNDRPFTKFPPLAKNARINDPFLSTILQMVQVDYIPTSCVMIPAHRACLGTARVEDGSQQVILKFQKVLDEITKISFDEEYSLNLVYKGSDQEDSVTSSMYS